MNRKIFNYLEIAGNIAITDFGEKNFLLGAVGERNDGAIVKAFNGRVETPNPSAHAEARLSKKLDYYATVYVARIKYIDGKFGMARPCIHCQKALAGKKVDKIYYTINSECYGLLRLDKDTDKIYSF